MAKKKTQDIQISANAVLTPEMLEDAINAATSKGLRSTSPIFFIDEPFDEYRKIKEHNQQRFLNYCHKGTILEHGTSKVKWEVLGLEDGFIQEPGPSFTMFEIPNKFVKMQSLVGGAKTGKKYVKRVPVETFYMYDIVEVPDAVKVLWGDPKDNPPKKPSYSR
jgi:hypothetical protein